MILSMESSSIQKLFKIQTNAKVVGMLLSLLFRILLITKNE